MTRDRIVIVGAGQAGARAAEALRAGGFAGSATLIGAEAEPPYERPALSKGVLLGSETAESTQCLPRAFYDERAIELRLSTRVEAIAPAAQRILLSSGEWMAYDKLLLCTGSRVRPLPGQPRKRFGGIRELAASIVEIGQATPGIVTLVTDDPAFDAQLVDGERRLRACRLAGRPFRAEVREDGDDESIFAASFAANFGR